MEIIYPPHKKQSAKVVELSRELENDIEGMEKMMEKQKFINGRKGYAIAHCQVSNNPYRIFVSVVDVLPHTCVINPVLLEKYESYTVKEGCLSFPFRGEKKVKRYRKIKVYYQDRYLQEHTKEFEGLPAQIFQHEIQHFNGENIYNP